MITVNLPKFLDFASVAICPSNKTTYWLASDVQLGSLPETNGHYYYSDVPYYPDHMYVMHGYCKRRQVKYFGSVEELNEFFQDHNVGQGFHLCGLGDYISYTSTNDFSNIGNFKVTKQTLLRQFFNKIFLSSLSIN